MYFQKPGRKSEKTWKKFRKPGENFQKTFGHPVIVIVCKKVCKMQAEQLKILLDLKKTLKIYGSWFEFTLNYAKLGLLTQTSARVGSQK